MEYVLKTNSLCKNYGHFKALNGLSMNVPKGSIYGLIGKNGAGKTTLIRLICGLQEPTSGDYVLYGKKHIDKDITKSRRRMGAIVETPSIYVDLTAYENLKEQYKVLGIPSDDGISEILKLVGLENTGNKKALPGTRMGSAGRTGRRNKRFGDKKWGFRSVSSTGTPNV